MSGFISRVFVLLLFSTTIGLCQVNVSVKQFGAKGDGVTDDYVAMQAAATYVCGKPGSTLTYPSGVYYIGRYSIIAGPKANGVKNIRYVGCNGVTITGYGAKIDVFGAFRRAADYVSGADAISYSNGITPFQIINSSNFTIKGFELDGNVDRMTRDPKVAEGDNAGILTTNCRNYTLQDLNVHHFHTDGIKLGGASLTADREATVVNVTAANNARQGLSIIQVYGATITGSVFRDTGRTGAYGVHDPGAGVDVEPNRTTPEVDIRTGMITFNNCRFEENLGSQFVSIWPNRVDSITVQNSAIKATATDTSPVAYLSAPVYGQTINNTFQLAAGHQVALMIAPTKTDRFGLVSRLLYSANAFQLGDRLGIASVDQHCPVDFTNNRVTVNSSGTDTNVLALMNIDRADGNTFSLSGRGYAGSSGTATWGVGYMGVPIVTNNQYTTDLVSPRFFNTVYYGPGMSVSGEIFPSTTFRPLSVGR
jgi:hypothetical protein